MSDWNESSRIRKDFRHSHDGPEVPRGYRAVSADKKRKRKKKIRSRWCGKKGNEHHVVLYGAGTFQYAKCSVCHMHEYNLPLEALAQVYERARTYLEYRDLCIEYGHTYKTVKIGTWWKYKVELCEVCQYIPRFYTWEDVDIVG